MLTVFDENSESGFLYFKDAQLIEVNTGKLWGVHALGEIFKWQLSSYTLGELPMGIKRSLWDPLDKLVEQFAGEGAGAGLIDLAKDVQDEQSSSLAPSFQLDESSPLTPLLASLQQLAGFQALFQEESGSLIKLFGKSPLTTLSPDWFDDFYKKVDAMSEGLGAGLLLEWYMELELCRVWKFNYGLYQLILLADLESDPDDFEDSCRSLIKEVVQ